MPLFFLEITLLKISEITKPLERNTTREQKSPKNTQKSQEKLEHFSATKEQSVDQSTSQQDNPQDLNSQKNDQMLSSRSQQNNAEQIKTSTKKILLPQL